MPNELELGDAALHWKVLLTLRVVLSEKDVSSLEPPPPLYLQLSRQSYLHFLLPQIKPLWQHVLTPGEHIPWFSYNSLPLKWNVPAGVLFDLLAPGSHERSAPWPLTLHFTGYPSSTLTPYAGEPSLQGYLQNSMKEASFIACGEAMSVMRMVPAAKEDLWKAVLDSNFRQYKMVLHSLPLKSPDMQAVPVRLFIRGGSSGYLSSYESITQTSRPLPAGRGGSSADGDRTGEKVDLQAALCPILARWLHSMGREKYGKEAEEIKLNLDKIWDQVGSFYVGGVTPPVNTPLVELHRDLHAPDFFLYIVLHMRSPS